MVTAEQFWNNIPPITKYLVVFSLSLTLITQFGMVDVYTLIIDFRMIFSWHLELWRLITGFFFFGGFSFSFLINFLIFLDYSSKLERDQFNGRSADFVFMLLLGAIPMLLAAYLLNIPVLSFTLMTYMLYIWCNLNSNALLSLFMLPFQIPARYFPWALMAFHMLMGGSPIYDLVGIIAGHMYYFVMLYYPREYNKVLLQTPGFLLSLFPPNRMNVTGFALNMNTPSARQQQQQQQQQMERPAAYRWGAGRRLGAE